MTLFISLDTVSYNLSRLFRDLFVCLQDIETFDLEDFKYNSVNMTAFRLVDLEEAKVAETLRQMERFQPIGHAILNKTGVIQVGRNFKLKVKKKKKKKPTNFSLVITRKSTPNVDKTNVFFCWQLSNFFF